MLSHRIVRFTVCLAALIPFTTQAEEEHWYNYDHLYFEAGTYIHYDPDEDHAGNRLFTSLEAVKANDWIYGLALFNNSFDQFSQYLYGGKSWDFPGKFDCHSRKLISHPITPPPVHNGDVSHRLPEIAQPFQVLATALIVIQDYPSLATDACASSDNS